MWEIYDEQRKKILFEISLELEKTKHINFVLFTCAGSHARCDDDERVDDRTKCMSLLVVSVFFLVAMWTEYSSVSLARRSAAQYTTNDDDENPLNRTIIKKIHSFELDLLPLQQFPRFPFFDSIFISFSSLRVVSISMWHVSLLICISLQLLEIIFSLCSLLLTMTKDKRARFLLEKLLFRYVFVHKIFSLFNFDLFFTSFISAPCLPPSPHLYRLKSRANALLLFDAPQSPPDSIWVCQEERVRRGEQ